jgi:hypothetical protein
MNALLKKLIQAFSTTFTIPSQFLTWSKFPWLIVLDCHTGISFVGKKTFDCATYYSFSLMFPPKVSNRWNIPNKHLIWRLREIAVRVWVNPCKIREVFLEYVDVQFVFNITVKIKACQHWATQCLPGATTYNYQQIILIF